MYPYLKKEGETGKQGKKEETEGGSIPSSMSEIYFIIKVFRNKSWTVSHSLVVSKEKGKGREFPESQICPSFCKKF